MIGDEDKRKQTDRQTNNLTHTQKHTDTQTKTDRHTDRHTHTHTQKDRQTDRQTGTHTVIHPTPNAAGKRNIRCAGNIDATSHPHRTLHR